MQPVTKYLHFLFHSSIFTTSTTNTELKMGRIYCKKCDAITERNCSGTCKPCQSARSKKWREDNKEKHIARVAKWHAENPLRVKEKQAKWAAKNPEKLRLKSARWRAANLDKAREIGRRNQHNRQSKKTESGGTLSSGLVDKLFVLQRGKCACGCKKQLGNNYHLDHIMPLSLGGSNTDNNIQLLTATCNMKKHAKHPIDFMQEKGFLI